MIKTVIKYQDKMVSAFDKNGHLISEYQDLYDKVKESVLKNAPPDAVFYHAFDTSPVLRKVKREEW